MDINDIKSLGIAHAHWATFVELYAGNRVIPYYNNITGLIEKIEHYLDTLLVRIDEYEYTPNGFITKEKYTIFVYNTSNELVEKKLVTVTHEFNDNGFWLGATLTTEDLPIV